MGASKPKIALIVPGFADGGGVPSVAMFLRRVIADSGRYECDLVSIATSSRDSASTHLLCPTSWLKEPEIVSTEVQGVRLNHVGCRFAELEFQRYLPRTVLNELLAKYDLIQVVAGAPMAGLSILRVDRPKCLTVGTLVRRDRESLLAQARGAERAWRFVMVAVNERIERAVLPRMTHVFAQSVYTQQLLERNVSRNRLSFGPPGVDTSIFKPGQYQADGYILSVGRFSDRRKNVSLLFKAYDRVRRQMSRPPKLVLAGNAEPTSHDWELVRAAGIEAHVEFRRNPSTEALARLYRDGSVFVLSSDEEGFGVVLLEAMASGLPVVSTRCGGPETLVQDGETGYLTPVGNASALCGRICELLEQPALRKRMGEAGRESVERSFSLEASGRVYLEKYDELLA